MKKIKEKIYKYLCTMLAFSSLIFLLGITFTLFKEGLPIFQEVPFLKFLFGRDWYPTHEPAEFGIFPLIAASLWITAGAILVGVPLGVGSALYLSELSGPRQRAILKPMIEVLASIPSIVYGFFGMVVIAPFLQRLLNIPTGLCGLTASIILGIMAIPMICSIAEDALSFVPRSFREASLALGATRWQTLTRVILPAAGSGISTSIIIGTSRAVGETMTVLMVAGGAAVTPIHVADILKPMRPITSTIAAEMGESVMGGTHYHALFALGLILFLTTLVFNILAEVISRRFRVKLGLAG